jgi:hypothetical protein
MALHCTCRLGFLDKLYQQRYTISYAIGLIEEIPIAMCNSNHDFGQGLMIDTQREDTSLPTPLVQTHEINLFFSSVSTPQLHNNSITLELIFTLEEDNLIHSDFTSVFHPPTHC